MRASSDSDTQSTSQDSRMNNKFENMKDLTSPLQIENFSEEKAGVFACILDWLSAAIERACKDGSNIRLFAKAVKEAQS